MEKRLKVIIAHNSADLGQNCERSLKSYGMDVTLCEKDGLKVIEATKKLKPDVILADVFMPNADILSVLSEIKKIDEKERPLVMAMSSFDNSRLEKEMLDGGASYYFLKPFDMNMLAERIIKLSGWKKRGFAGNCEKQRTYRFGS